ncbi:uncharacterized protein LOC111374018 [Olea europaea var. sylvestris]|uniref:uncharacterized protein LOC111374018 n=1 Tax=Olea europaea var. sylvestris TaxID=158386 RepID=UPI000C1CE1E2|nr:uncharacterized protein LOC111374018 [Olea europaea var. sylvestris]
MTDVPVNNQSSTTSESSYNEAESNSTMALTGLDNASFQLMVEKLNGRNFKEWAQSIKLVIDGKGKLGYLTGETHKPTDSALLQKWKSENSMVTAWLVNFMHPSIGKTYLFLPTVKDVWDDAKEMYSNSKNSSQIFEIKSRLCRQNKEKEMLPTNTQK